MTMSASVSPEASEAEVMAALRAAQCMDIIEKFPQGVNTVIGSEGIYLSGGEMQRIAIASRNAQKRARAHP